MATEVKLPEIGDGIKSGDILDILVSVGDSIGADQGIVEIETDKATVEIPSPLAGKVTAIHVTKGQSVPIGGLLISLDAVTPAASPALPATPAQPQSAQSQSAQSSATPPLSPPPANAKVPPAIQLTGKPTESPVPVSPVPVSPVPVSQKLATHPAVSAPTTSEAGDKSDRHVIVPAGPSVRRFAREVGVDLAVVAGTGPAGRITRDDVLSVVRQANQGHGNHLSTKSPALVAAPAAESPPATIPAKVSSPTLDGEVGADPWGPIRLQKMAKIRKTIANKMQESWSTIPRVTNFDDADITELERMRQGSKDDYARSGIKLTSMPFVIKAVALALKSNPLLNASIDMVHEQIIYKNYVNIGIAVDTDRGLVVPSLRHADQLSIPAIARALQDVAESARTGSFAVDDLRGSTFSISNLGAIGGTYSTPIINPPEVAILLVGRSRKLPVAVSDEIAVRLMMPLSLSYDHRLVDGGAAARFLNEVIGYLSTPSRLFIAP